MKIVITGGGTGGHIFPLIAIVRELKGLWLQKKLQGNKNIFGETLPEKVKPEQKLEICYLGPKDDFGLILLSQEGVKTREIAAGKVRRYLNWKSFLENIIDIFFRAPLGVFQSFFLLFFLAPDFIFSKGGYGSFPVVIAGWLLRIPIFLHESDVDPGLTNKILAKFAKKVFVSFPKTERFPPSKMILAGNPIRKEILGGNINEAKELLKLNGGKPVILIIGGSQGSQRINELVLTILPKLLEEFELIHQVGEKNFLTFRAEADITCPQELKKFYHYFPFLREEQYKQAYVAADLVVARASGGTIFEIAAMAKPSILIPYPEAAQNHQLKNGYAFAKDGATIVMEEANLTPNFFLEKLKYLFSQPSELEKMASAAAKFARINAAKDIAQYLFGFLIQR